MRNRGKMRQDKSQGKILIGEGGGKGVGGEKRTGGSPIVQNAGPKPTAELNKNVGQDM